MRARFNTLFKLTTQSLRRVFHAKRNSLHKHYAYQRCPSESLVLQQKQVEATIPRDAKGIQIHS